MDTTKRTKLLQYCRLSQSHLKTFLESELLRQRGKERVESRDGFLYSPGSHPVLLVAHLDTVHKKLPTTFYLYDGDVLHCNEGIGGDDRCGVFIIMELIERLDCHVLFTEDEEIGGLGAIQFSESGIKPEVQYIVEFDRQGKDEAVFYGCDNVQFTDFVERHGFWQNIGTFSDISYIAPALGIAAVNLSCGYYHAHTAHEVIRMSDLDSIIERAAGLLSHVDTEYEYIEERWDWATDWNRETRCPYCGQMIDQATFYDNCPRCGLSFLLQCDECGHEEWVGDCVVIQNSIYCRHCLDGYRHRLAAPLSQSLLAFTR